MANVPYPQTQMFNSPSVSAPNRTWQQYFLSLTPRDPTGTSTPATGSALYWDGTKVVGSSSISIGVSTNTINFIGGGSITETSGGVTYDYLANTPAPVYAPQQVSAGAGTTLTGANVLAPVLLRTGPGAGFTDTTPTQAQIAAATLQVRLGVGFLGLTLYGQPLLMINGSGFAWTLVANTNVQFFGNTSGGNFVIPANSSRPFYLVVTDGGAVTAHSQFYG